MALIEEGKFAIKIKGNQAGGFEALAAHLKRLAWNQRVGV